MNMKIAHVFTSSNNKYLSLTRPNVVPSTVSFITYKVITNRSVTAGRTSGQLCYAWIPTGHQYLHQVLTRS